MSFYGPGVHCQFVIRRMTVALKKNKLELLKLIDSVVRQIDKNVATEKAHTILTNY